MVGAPYIQGFLKSGSSVVPGKVNNALYTNGNSYGVTLTGDALDNSPVTQPELGDFTAMLWMRHEGPTGNGNGKFVIATFPRGFHLMHYENKLTLKFKTQTQAYYWHFPGKSFSVWYHIAVVWSSSDNTPVAYQNGNLVAVFSQVPETLTTPGPGKIQLGIAASLSAPTRAKCFVDDIKIWNTVKSSEFIMHQYLLSA